jgi:hypothetical protein
MFTTNIQPMIMEALTDMKQGKMKDVAMGLDAFKTLTGQIKEDREEKIEQLEKQMQAEGNEDKLKEQVGILKLSKWIQDKQHGIKDLIQDIRKDGKEMQREQKRLEEGIQVLEKGSDDLLRMDELPSQLTVPVNQVGAAEATVIASQHFTRLQNKLGARLQNEEVKNSIEKQRGASQGLLDALKKNKLFALAFKVFAVVVDAVVTYFTAGAGRPYVQALMPLLQKLWMKPVENQIEQAQTDQGNGLSQQNQDEQDWQQAMNEQASSDQQADKILGKMK